MISAAALLAAMSLGIGAAPAPLDCQRVTPMLASVPSQIMAGNFPDGSGGCVIWLNINYDDTAADACKLAMHEAGHLAGLQHSTDTSSVMYAPYVAKPYPPACAQLVPRPKRKAKRARRHR